MNASDAVGEAIFFLLLLCWLVLLPAWTYRDAKKNSFNPKLCLLLVLFCPEGFSSICFTKAATSDSERGAFRLDAVPFRKTINLTPA